VAKLTSAFRGRLLPTVLTAAGMSIITAGLLTYRAPIEAGPGPTDPQQLVASPSPTVALPTIPPVAGSLSPSASAAPRAGRVATRIVIPALKIDLPVIRPAGGADAYPQCNVAMYIGSADLHQPGQGKATYIYAHARDGMFGPIYHLAIEKGTPNALVGRVVEVYTSDDQRFLYEISEVRLHQRTLVDAQNATTEQLWLQTSEGPDSSYPKTQLLALPIGVLPASHAAAHPTPNPVNCG
jgi:hypothetical protein